VIAIDRQPRADGGLEQDPNVIWHRIDLADADVVRSTFDEIRAGGGATALVHLAAYYDFTGEPHPEYQRTNVEATRLVLENSLGLGLRRFVFASSVAACDFSTPGQPLNEDTPPLGRHVYAVSKRAGEELVRRFSDRIPGCIVRFAALFSDWCEYPPLYFFLETWLSERWNARILGGKGQSAIPFLHVRDATLFVLRVLERSDQLDPCEVLIASPDGAVTHAELFETATRYYFGAARRPLHVPKSLCGPGMWLRDALGLVLGERPFERSWMAAYVDRQMVVDAARSRRRLEWRPRKRLHILERIPFMIENSKTNRVEWYGRNLEALEHHRLQPRLQVYRLARRHEAELERAFDAALATGQDQRTSHGEVEWMCRSALRALMQAIRTGDRTPFVGYCHDLARRQLELGASAEEVTSRLRALERACLRVLGSDEQARGLEASLRDSVSVTIDFGIDRVLEAYECRERMIPDEG
jgi:nucleoside-diphosphate-sugar epimerase